MMMEPPVEDLLEKVGCGKYELVILASKRARQINAYYNQLGEGIGAYVPPQVVSEGKPLSIAFEEIEEDKLVPAHPESAPEEAPDQLS
jgi:DNA-directed RNA polymerase subunit omega